MNGNGAPTTGRNPITIPTLTSTYKKIVKLSVALNILPKLSVALMEILNPRKATKRYNVINIRTPKNPNSPPNAVNIKSVECSGTKPSFDWVPLKIPLPKNPPDPRAILDCIK